MWKLRFVFFTLLLGFIFLQEARATHIRAGEITGVRTGFLSYQFTIRVYTDNSSSADSPQLTINFGDNTTSVAPRVNRFDIGNNTSVNVYQVNHTYAAPGSYRVFFVEENRNAGVLNMDNSVLTPFSVETFVFINSAVGLNDTPILTVDPIDLACVGNRFKHNPGAFDPDGDSLSFKLVVPFQSGTQPVNNYRDPNNPAFNGETEDGLPPGIFSIDPITGDLVWDAPGTAGEYNIAFIVEEWRNGIRIGFVKRDMQIIVNDCPNRRPRLVVPNVCVVANEDPSEDTNIINEIITAIDPDIPLQNLIISSDQDQGVYDPSFFNTTATFTFTPTPQTSPAEATFRWDTRCEHVREQPYLLVFKAEDDPLEPNNTALVDIQTMVITVKGPPPVNLTATPQGRATDLSWDDYRLQCPGFTPTQFDAMEIVIWRREGCNAVIACEQDPAMLGFEAIGTVGVEETTFRDNGPLSVGISYSYVITANFPEPLGGVSLASTEVCVRLPVVAPVITNVSVLNTATASGEIEVRWIFPPELDLASFPGPYSYNIYRAEGLNGTNFVRINTLPIPDPAADPSAPLSFTDTGLNTQDLAYRYFVEFFADITGVPTDSSDMASSVRLDALPAENSIILEWNFNVPWSNRTDVAEGVGPHLIYRRTANVGVFQLIDSVSVGQTRYVDVGQFNNECLNPDSVYVYYVTTRGSYFNPTVIPVSPLLNDSQEDSASPEDNTPPPAPVLSILPNDCSFLDAKLCSDPPNFNGSTLSNTLFWEIPDIDNNTCEAVSRFALFYRPPGQEAFDFGNPIYTGPDTFFVHQNLPEVSPGLRSQAGCYVVIAIDQSSNQSQPSNEVCQDNCLYFELPNVITINGDGRNETFIPCPNPLYVEQVDFEVYNRWGNLVFERDDTIQIEWDGRDQGGNEVATGVYFYVAKVRFLSIDPTKQERTFRGTIHVIRSQDQN